MLVTWHQLHRKQPVKLQCYSCFTDFCGTFCDHQLRQLRVSTKCQWKFWVCSLLVQCVLLVSQDCYCFGYIGQLSVCGSMPSVLWRCWLGGRKGIRPVKQEAELSPRDRAMRRVNWNFANCHTTVQKLLIRQVLTKSMVWSWRFSRRQCVIDNVHSTMTRSRRLPLSQVS